MGPGDADWSRGLMLGELSLTSVIGAPREGEEVPSGPVAVTQPECVAPLWNFKGYMNNTWHRVRLRAG